MRKQPGPSSAAVLMALQLIAAGGLGGPAAARELALHPRAALDAAQQGAPAAASPTETARTARETYAAGVAAYRRAVYAEAAALFARADALSSSPNAKLMLGRCLRQLRRLTEAYRALFDSVRQAERADPLRYAKTRNAARSELEVIRDQIGLLTVYVHARSGPAYLHVAGQPILRHEWQVPVPVQPGTVKLSLETLPGVIEHRELEIVAGESASVVIGTPPELEEPVGASEIRPGELVMPDSADPQSSPLRVTSYIVGASGAAGLIAFGVLGALSSAAFRELEAGCPIKTRCDPNLKPVAERGQALQTGANIALAAGAATLGTGIVLFFLAGSTESPPAESAKRAARGPIAVSPLGLEVRGEL